MFKGCFVELFFFNCSSLDVFHRNGHAMIPCKRGLVSVQISPVKSGHRACFLVMKLTGPTMVAHPIDVCGTSHVGFGHHGRAQGKGSHAQHIRLNHPIVGINKRSVKPIREFSWG